MKTGPHQITNLPSVRLTIARLKSIKLTNLTGRQQHNHTRCYSHVLHNWLTGGSISPFSSSSARLLILGFKTFFLLFFGFSIVVVVVLVPSLFSFLLPCIMRRYSRIILPIQLNAKLDNFLQFFSSLRLVTLTVAVAVNVCQKWLDWIHSKKERRKKNESKL